MAAIIVAIRAKMSDKNKVNKVHSADCDQGSFDKNLDGKVSVEEMRAAFDKVSIRTDILQQRISFENGMVQMCWKLPNFLLCVLCFLVALCEFSPPGSLNMVHKHIADHFKTADALNVKTIDDIYAYMEAFELKNELLQATSSKFWCERRYFESHWDDHYLVPVNSCRSPRLAALGFGSDAYKWSALQASTESRRRSDGGHRQLSGDPPRRRAPDGSAPRRRIHYTIVPATHSNPPCEDNSTKLQIEEGRTDITCENFASHVCEIDLGILLCPQTCGYCAPFQYVHTKRFVKSQVTMLPVMIYQTRFETKKCDGMANTYEMQPYNPRLSLLPALDGQRLGRVLTCVDREKHYEGAYAISLDCPADTPASHCHHGKVHNTEKHTFHGDVVYPKLLIEPHRDIKAMQKVDWLDVQTETVSFSTLIYTIGLEIFTSLTVDFTFDPAGNINAHVKSISYRDLINGSQTTFIGCLVVCIVGAFLGVGLSFITILKNPECNLGFAMYELISRGILFLYPFILLVSWSKQVPMAEEYKILLDQFMNLESMEHHDLEVAVQQYFDVKTHIYSETSWLTNHRMVAYIVCYVQFLQLIFYFNAHPRMAVLTSTISKGMTNIVHFLFLFGMLFVMMAFMAHWALGEHIKAFGTFGDTISAQARMIFGEFIYADGASDLHGAMMMVYWLYASTFMLIMFFTLLNFFLAIIVDAFVDVKAENDQLVVVRDFLTDFIQTPFTVAKYSMYKWPSQNKLKEWLARYIEEAEAQDDVPWFDSLQASEKEASGKEKEKAEEEARRRRLCTAQDLVKAFPEFKNEEDVARFMLHYYHISKLFFEKRTDNDVKPMTAESKPTMQ